MNCKIIIVNKDIIKIIFKLNEGLKSSFEAILDT